MPVMTGGCRCGHVRYRADAEPLFTGICHCTQCQKQSGAAFTVVVAVPQAALSVEGPAKSYTTRGDSGKPVVSRFCPNCGSTVIVEPEAMPGVTEIMAGTLDDTSWVTPEEEIYCDSAQRWVRLGGDRRRFPKMPPLPTG